MDGRIVTELEFILSYHLCWLHCSEVSMRLYLENHQDPTISRMVYPRSHSSMKYVACSTKSYKSPTNCPICTNICLKCFKCLPNSSALKRRYRPKCNITCNHRLHQMAGTCMSCAGNVYIKSARVSMVHWKDTCIMWMRSFARRKMAGLVSAG